METVRVFRDDARDMQFTGERVAYRKSREKSGRWREFRVWKTARGRYVCGKIDCTAWQGEHDRFSAIACDSHADIVEFFGLSDMAKALYADLGIDDCEHVD